MIGAGEFSLRLQVQRPEYSDAATTTGVVKYLAVGEMWVAAQPIAGDGDRRAIDPAQAQSWRLHARAPCPAKAGWRLVAGDRVWRVRSGWLAEPGVEELLCDLIDV